MTDRLTKRQRSYVMSRIRGKDTTIEVLLRSALFEKGYRFRKHVKGLPGRPDIVFHRARVAVFVDGDFWHGYQFPRWENSLPKFWRQKIRTNRQRDRRCYAKLRRAGWRVVRVWEHEIRRDVHSVLLRVTAVLKERSTGGG